MSIINKLIGTPAGRMDNVLDSKIVERAFYLQSRYYVNIKTNALGICMIPFIIHWY